MIRGLLRLAGLLALGFAYFFVPLGERTLHQHVMRIAATEEAQDLGAEASVAALGAADRIRAELEATAQDAGVPEDAGAQDAETDTNSEESAAN